MFESILFPSAAISHNYESYFVALENGTTVTGLLISKTPTSVTIKDAESIIRTFKQNDIDKMVKQPISLMPADLTKLMTNQEIVDVVDYLTTLKKKKTTKKTSFLTPQRIRFGSPTRQWRDAPIRHVAMRARRES